MNGAKARFLTLEPVSLTEPEAGMKLVEHDSLLNVENELLGQDPTAASYPRTVDRAGLGVNFL
jgi:hypothetical protein